MSNPSHILYIMDVSQDTDHDYDGNSDGGPKEEFLEYTDLAVAEKGILKYILIQFILKKLLYNK